MLVVRGRHAKVMLIGRIAIKMFYKDVGKNAKKEYEVLKFLEPYGIAPKPYFWIRNTIVMERISGRPWQELSKEEKKAYFLKFLDVLHLLDKLKINKKECHRPEKHFIVTYSGDVKLIDFERAVKKEKPSNVTQFIARFFKHNQKVLEAAKKYKRGEIPYKVLRDLISSELSRPEVLDLL